jgi:hypothetical protein
MRLFRRSFLVLLLFACNSTGVGNPPAPAASVKLSIVRDDELEPDLDAEGGAGSGGAPGSEPEASLPRANIHQAIVVLGALRFLPCDPADGVTELSGPFVVDLMSGATAPEIPSVELPASGLCGLDAPLAPARAPASLQGRSLLFQGTRADETPFLVSADMRATLRLRAPEGVSFSGPAGEERSLFWAMRPRRWLSPPELDGAEPTELEDGSRAIVIDVNRYPLLFLLLRMRLATRSTLHEDVNRDGTFGVDDRAAVVGHGLEDTD